MIFEPELKADALRAGVPRPPPATTARRGCCSTRSPGPTRASSPTRCSTSTSNHYLPDCLLVKVDIATMAHGLEGRSPMLDHEFMEFAASLPADFKLRGGTTKYILKKAVRQLVPADIIDRPKKGFGVPLDHWFRNELREMSGDVLLVAARAAARLLQAGRRAPHARRALERHRRRGTTTSGRC